MSIFYSFMAGLVILVIAYEVFHRRDMTLDNNPHPGAQADDNDLHTGIVETDGDHTHGPWKRGMLPGQKYIKTCGGCGKFETIDIDEWMKLG